ncbi:MAG: bacteriohemerythrin [Fidelibacterota bacterium]
MGIKFIWENKYNVGDEEINNQHQYIFQLGNEIQEAPLNDAGRYVLKLIRYSKKHFIHEEAHMKTIGFPELERHKELHDKLIAKLGDISADFIKNEDEFAAFKNFLYQWLIDHILYEDKKYFDFANRQDDNK